MENNTLPECNYCNEKSQAEWTFVYGNDPQNHYTFCCTKHIPAMIESISKGRNGEVKAGYLVKWNTKTFYDASFNETWKRFFNKL